jgi:predicted xylose isomerase-like sugar epimerase
LARYLLKNTTGVGAQRELLVTINEMGHWYFYAKDRKNISKVIVRIKGKFIAFIFQIFVEPL